MLIAVFGPLTGWAFIGTGVFAWLRRPENRVGGLMIAVGFAACLGALRVSTEPWVFITGLLFIALPYAVSTTCWSPSRPEPSQAAPSASSSGWAT